MQVWNEQDAQEECLAMVVHTGSNTSVGQMLLQIDNRKGRKASSYQFGMHAQVNWPSLICLAPASVLPVVMLPFISLRYAAASETHAVMFWSDQNFIYAMLVQDLRRFILLVLVANLIIFFVQVPWMIRVHLQGTYLLFQFVLSVLDVVNPLLPAALVVLKAVTTLRMRHQGLHLVDNNKLFVAAQLDLVVMDKTGTLTADQVSLAW